MATRYDLQVLFGYRSKLYKNLLKQNEWAANIQVQYRVKATNNTSILFPGCQITVDITEHGLSLGSKYLQWSLANKINIPPIQSGKSGYTDYISFTPVVQGPCEINITIEEPSDSEVWLTGWHQATPVRKTIGHMFNVVNRQELEIITQLQSILSKGE